MTNLQQLVCPDCVILELAESDREEVVLEMISHLAEIGKMASNDCYLFGNAVLERESHVGTGVGSGVAIPHARVKGLKEPLIVFGRSAKIFRQSELRAQFENATSADEICALFSSAIPA